MSSSTYRYLDIDSTYRNRNQYPNPADFVIPVTNGPSNGQTAFQASDPVSLAYPLEYTTVVSATTGTVQASTGPVYDNYYTGKYLFTQNGTRIISSYAASSVTYTFSPSLSSAPSAGSQITIAAALPSYTGFLGASTQNILNLTTGAANNPNTPVIGNFIYMGTGSSNFGTAIQIVASTGTFVTLAKPLPVSPVVGDLYEILPYSYDNFYPLSYPGTVVGTNQPVCYAIELINLIIPNVGLISGYGGTFSDYPYLYVDLYNEGNTHTGQTLYTNNPHGLFALFKVPIGLNLLYETFFCLKDCRQIQVVKWKPNETLRFRVRLPNGSPVVFKTADNVSPESPNPLLQISATFSIRRLDGDFAK